MPTIAKTMKIHIHTDKHADAEFRKLTSAYSYACNLISDYIFNHNFETGFMKLQEKIYHKIRNESGLKSQLTISALKTVSAKYKTVKKQLIQNPYKYRTKDGRTICIRKDLSWLEKPVHFSRPQADLVRSRDYSFIDNKKKISVNTLGKRVKVTFDMPENFACYFNEGWSFGTAKLVSLKNKWYLHIPVTKDIPDSFSPESPSHIVGIDRGLRFIAVSYDEKGNCSFFNGKDILQKRSKFMKVRKELQSKGTKSSKRRLKALSGRENRWMTDVNHQLSKALADRYGSNTLFVIEDLSGISFRGGSMSSRNKKQHREISSWSFYQLEQFLMYKAKEKGSFVLKVPATYTSQRCPKCGRIHKNNRRHKTHEYVCDVCGYRSNDDRVGAMNLYVLGTLFVSGNENPYFRKCA